MSVSHVTSSKFTIAGTTTGGNILIPSTIIAGHDLYVMVTSRGHDATTAYPTVTDTDSGGNTFALQGETPQRKGTLFWKKATSGTASKLITVAGALNSCAAGLSAYSGGLSSGNPTTNIAAESSNAGDNSHTGFVPDFANSMVCLAVYNYLDDDSVSAMTCAGIGTMEPERFELLSTGGSDCAVIHGSVVQPGALASTETLSWTQSSTVTKRSIVWAIRPQPEVGSGTTQSPVHTYAGAGTYVVRLTVFDNLGASSSTTKAVTVS